MLCSAYNAAMNSGVWKKKKRLVNARKVWQQHCEVLSYLQTAKVRLTKTHCYEDAILFCFLFRSFFVTMTNVILECWDYWRGSVSFEDRTLDYRKWWCYKMSHRIELPVEPEFWSRQQELKWIKLCVVATDFDVKSVWKDQIDHLQDHLEVNKTDLLSLKWNSKCIVYFIVHWLTY